MEIDDKVSKLQAMTGILNLGQDFFVVYLDLAKSKILNTLYPFGIPEGVTDIPDRFIPNQLEIATYLINKRGAEGETAHSENGISRTYENADIPKALLEDILPYAKIGDDYANNGD